MISAIVLTKNEEKNIIECLRTLTWCDEIIIIDDFSGDETIKKTQNLKLKVFKRHLNRDFAEQRNFGLEKAVGDWVLFVDADERVTRRLREEIVSNVKSKRNDTHGFYLKRDDYFLGKWLKHGETSKVKLLRLGKKGKGFFEREVDERWRIVEKTEELKNPLLHYPHQTLGKFLKSINDYSTLNAQVFYQRNHRLTFFEWLKPLAKFIQNYFFRLGFLDGIQGFIMAMMMSYHSFLVRTKLWMRQKR